MEELLIPKSKHKKEVHEALMPQIEALIKSEVDLIANLANTAAVLNEALDFFWVGFYLVKDEELVLGPFQGPLACTRISFGKGVCGTSWQNKETIIVPDVEQFPGHIVCSSESKSEIVVPGIVDGEVVLTRVTEPLVKMYSKSYSAVFVIAIVETFVDPDKIRVVAVGVIDVAEAMVSPVKPNIPALFISAFQEFTDT